MTQSSSDPLMPAKITYGLYGVGFFLPLLTIAGVIFAYVSKGKNPVLDTHLIHLIRTFWIGLAIAVAGFITSFILIGFLVLLGGALWMIVRLITGLLLVLDGKPVTGTTTLGMVAV